MTTYKKEGTTHNTHSTQVNCILTNSTYLGKKKEQFITLWSSIILLPQKEIIKIFFAVIMKKWMALSL